MVLSLVLCLVAIKLEKIKKITKCEGAHFGHALIGIFQSCNGGLGQCLLHFISRGKSKNDKMKLKVMGYEFSLTQTLYMISSTTGGTI